MYSIRSRRRGTVLYALIVFEGYLTSLKASRNSGWFLERIYD